MPLYDYECDKCLREFELLQTVAEHASAPCPSCGVRSKQILKPGKAPGLSLFQPGFWRDLGPQPIYINSPQELRDVCDRRGKTAPSLENSVFKTSPGPDPDPDVVVAKRKPRRDGYDRALR